MRKRSKPAQASDAIEAYCGQEIRRFEAAVPISFSFLERDYAFERRPAEHRDFEDGRDAHVVVPYYGTIVALEVQFWLAESQVGAAIYELEDGRMPELVSVYGHRGYARAITVDTFVELLSRGTERPVLPQASPRKPRIGVCRAAELRREALRADMEGVVAQYADKVKTWCVPILQGDTSSFPAVQKLHREKYWTDGWPIDVS